LRQAYGSGIPVYVVSSANRSAIEKEWRSKEIEPLTRGIFGQEDGTKVEILTRIASTVPDPQAVLMIGDSPGDQNAAREAETLFYPIIPKMEIESWKDLFTEVLPEFQKNELTTDKLQVYLAAFHQCIG
jgi:2-hydroxy-3-keto-5-methylthiopentenyl-1-phosphate phosphatase